MGYFRYGLTFAPNHLRARCLGYVRFASKFKVTDQTSNTLLPFSGLGLSKAVRLGLKSAFPAVAKATDAQATFIPAIIQGKDVMIKGHTGSGKCVESVILMSNVDLTMTAFRSFGLILALLSKCWNPLSDNKRSLPASLLLVPHRDLAYQFMYWIGRIATATNNPHHPTPTQVIVRGQGESSLHVSRLREKPPSIVIGTPQAILDVLQEDEHAIDFMGLSTVVVDEVDYLIDFIPADASRERKQRLATKMRRHPSAGKLLLDQIYSARARPDGPAAVDSSPQLVVCSATLQTGLRQQLYHAGWFKKGVDSIVKVRSELRAGETRKSIAAADVTLDAEAVQHCALVFSEDGSVSDIEGAVEPKWSSEDGEDGQEVQAGTDPEGDDLPNIPAPPTEGELAGQPSLQITNSGFAVMPYAFDPVLIEGIATVFATTVPKVALLVLPASAAVQRAVYELRALGINASGLDLRSEGYREGKEENPTLLVSTTASLRGIDLPELSHVFIWGVVDGNSYLHASGRVGRFGRKGRVVSVLEQGQSDRYLRLLKSMGLIPSKFYRA